MQTSATDEGMKYLIEADNLKQLDLWYNQIKDEGVEHLKEVDNLEELDLGRKDKR